MLFRPRSGRHTFVENILDMDYMINNTTQQPQSDEGANVNGLRMVLFMSFIPSIYLIGKLITELF